ncbi:TetR/AcrR family transcriptional regulator [Nonomuraea lactucae]|uniref:TetR/AcrR family transcriptional regulator n=1 Tax=Nonomuraea lactucae TaxID=2249762 RepID=UPI000DE2A3B5|nr:TetR/AcrR family transcriptional regulator [Nonomuraea lactucae]
MAMERATRRQRATPRKGDLREQAILRAAEELLEREGVEPMTVEAIATGAGISRGSLYFYFGSKQEVLTALVARTLAALTEDATAFTDDEATPPHEAIEHAISRTEHMWRGHGRVMRTAVDHAAVIPEIGHLWTATVATFTKVMTGVLVRAGIPDGDGPADAAALAHTLCWMTERAFYQAAAQPVPDLPRAAATCTEIWFRVINHRA